MSSPAYCAAPSIKTHISSAPQCTRESKMTDGIFRLVRTPINRMDRTEKSAPAPLENQAPPEKSGLRKIGRTELENQHLSPGKPGPPERSGLREFGHTGLKNQHLSPGWPGSLRNHIISVFVWYPCSCRRSIRTQKSSKSEYDLMES